jgi:hypothetical protein
LGCRPGYYYRDIEKITVERAKVAVSAALRTADGKKNQSTALLLANE